MNDDEIFCAALEQDSEDKQRELVESLCQGDLEQLERVSQLLATYHQMQCPGHDSQSILDRPDAFFQAFTGVEDLKAGKQVGRYVLGEMVGQGATSLVFRAKQLAPVEREVALKILKPGMDSHRILARFGLEHQVINRLEHPGVTPVYEAGVQENGRPFFAMELVPNPLAITEYAEKFGLDLCGRVQLMIATCDIVQHAHQRGVIHRDLKPSNILIEGVLQTVPKPRIIDFGIAKVMQANEGSGGFTTSGDRFGTPAYMSPEQAVMPASSVDIRSDVYSLGAILYELLTGFTPRDASDVSTIELPWTSSKYWEYDVKAPSRVNSRNVKPQGFSRMLTRFLQIRQKRSSKTGGGGAFYELDWITLKAIASDREDRYQTVADMQRDLQRFLNGEPVEAAGPSLVYRVKKLINRNRAISVATAVVLLTIVVTSIMTTFYAFLAHDAQRLVRVQLGETLDAQGKLLIERDRAEEAMRQSQSLLRIFQVQSVMNHALAKFFAKSLEAADRGQFELPNASAPIINIQAEVLMAPHRRLIVRGDWSWASSQFPADIINASFRINSSEAAQALSSRQSGVYATPSDVMGHQVQAIEQGGRVQGQVGPEAIEAKSPRVDAERESFQQILLEELRVVLPSNDPFIAEVLDNCGLQALDSDLFAEAKRFLTESVHIWSQGSKYSANLAQSQIFLAEAFIGLGQKEQAMKSLHEARQVLAGIPEGNPSLGALRELSSKLQAEASGLKSVGMP